MHRIEGNLLKMAVSDGPQVNYSLRLSNEQIQINDLIGSYLIIDYKGVINCIKCGNVTKTSFGQGFCYPCFMNAPENEPCVLRPELCRAHEGEARDMVYAENHCLIDHFVYLSYTGAIKVGVTRHTQIPTRWIDQGATHAIKLAKTPDRYTAGLIEVALKNHMSDKTNWRLMLADTSDHNPPLIAMKEQAIEWLDEHFYPFIDDDDSIHTFRYPVNKYPSKIASFNFDKMRRLEGRLSGIKGQYLIFEDGTVVNVRKFGGYLVEVGVGGDVFSTL